MKITVTGSLGNISKPLAESLIAGGNRVTIVSKDPKKIVAIEALGATAAIGSVEDIDFLTKAFTGADAVYVMVPPTFAVSDWKKYIAGIGSNYAEAIKKTGVKYVVNLSSIGAHLPDGTGPITGMHYAEEAYNALEGVNVLNLRPGSFYTNFNHSAGMIKGMGIIGANQPADAKQVLVSPNDIAAVAAKALNELSFTGKSHLYIVSAVHTGAEIASILGNAIGKPELPWVEFKDEDVVAAMLGNGATKDVSENYAEMGAALGTGKLYGDYNNSKFIAHGETSFEDFAKIFAKNF
jgi:uncharacterized protein YbjT (DUF2867 family)